MLGSFWSHSCTGLVETSWVPWRGQPKARHPIQSGAEFDTQTGVFAIWNKPQNLLCARTNPKFHESGWYFSETFKCNLKNSAGLQALSKAALLPFINHITTFHTDPFSFLSSSEHPREEPELWDLSGVNVFKSFVAYNSLGWSFCISSFWRKGEYW